MNAHLESLKETIRKAWLTLSMLPDPDVRFRRMFGGSWPVPFAQDPATGYGATPASWHGTPSAHEITEMEAVFDWLIWLRGVEGEYSLKRIGAWAMGRPIWQMAQREQCSAASIHNRINRSIAKIMAHFRNEHVRIAVIDEPEIRPDRIRSFTTPPEENQSGSITEPGKVFIAGVGMMFRGEKFTSAQEAAGEKCGKPRR